MSVAESAPRLSLGILPNPWSLHTHLNSYGFFFKAHPTSLESYGENAKKSFAETFKRWRFKKKIYAKTSTMSLEFIRMLLKLVKVNPHLSIPLN